MNYPTVHGFSVLISLVAGAMLATTMALWPRSAAIAPSRPHERAPQLASSHFAFPRGTAPAYGWIGCGDPKHGESCPGEYTLRQVGYAAGFNIGNNNAYATLFHERGELHTLVPYLGKQPDGERADEYWRNQLATFRQRGWTDQDIGMFYYVDEATDTRLLNAIDTARQLNFPDSYVLLSGVEGTPSRPDRYERFLDIADVYSVQTYPSARKQPFAYVYQQIAQSVADLRAHGKTVYQTPEAWGKVCSAQRDWPDVRTERLAYQRLQAQLIMGIAGGAQGVFAYFFTGGSNKSGNIPASGTACEQAIRDFQPQYQAIWPWIMHGERQVLDVAVQSGPRGGETEWGAYTSIGAWLMRDAEGRELLVIANLMDISETNNQASVATISGVPNGRWHALGTSGQVTITNGAFETTLRPYQFQMFVRDR